MVRLWPSSCRQVCLGRIHSWVDHIGSDVYKWAQSGNIFVTKLGSGGGVHRGGVLSYEDWGLGFDSQRKLNFFHTISVFTLIFCCSFRDTHLGHRAFPFFCLSSTTFLFNTNLSFLFLLFSSYVCKLFKVKKVLCLSLFSIYLTLLEPSINMILLLCGPVEQAKKIIWHACCQQCSTAAQL